MLIEYEIEDKFGMYNEDYLVVGRGRLGATFPRTHANTCLGNTCQPKVRPTNEERTRLHDIYNLFTMQF